MRVILDTNVLVAALRSEMGASYAIVAQLPSERFQMALTVPVYLQYQDVLTRPEHMTGASTRDDKQHLENLSRNVQRIAQQYRPLVGLAVNNSASNFAGTAYGGVPR